MFAYLRSVVWNSEPNVNFLLNSRIYKRNNLFGTLVMSVYRNWRLTAFGKELKSLKFCPTRYQSIWRTVSCTVFINTLIVSSLSTGIWVWTGRYWNVLEFHYKSTGILVWWFKTKLSQSSLRNQSYMIWWCKIIVIWNDVKWCAGECFTFLWYWKSISTRRWRIDR